MQLQLYQVDSFASRVFEGNPAAVCPLSSWLSDAQMLAIAAEHNLSETAFFVPQDDGFSIRWFTPTVEVDLCGHATLAAAFVLFELHGYSNNIIVFYSKSGTLLVNREDDGLVLDFPMQLPRPCETPQAILAAFKATPMACFKAEDYIVVFEHEKDVREAEPDVEILKQLDLRGVSITAASQTYDFVSRFFAPNVGINEDPVTGSSFTQLAPVWMAILGKESLFAKQVSKRGGEVWCDVRGNRVRIKGRAVLYMRAQITIPLA